jgi:hypothetical protein
MFTGVLHCCVFIAYNNPLAAGDQIDDPLAFLGGSSGKHLHDSELYKYVSWYESASLQPTPTSWCNIASPIECDLQSFFTALLPDQNVFAIVSPFGSLARLYLTRMEESLNIDRRPISIDLNKFASDPTFQGSPGRLISVVAHSGNTLVTASSLADNSLESWRSGVSDGEWVSVTVDMNGVEATITKDLNLQISRYPAEVPDLTEQLSKICEVLWQYKQ